MDAREHLVVGAGIAGLHAALLLARRGARVRVVEREARVGGLARAETFRGLPCDLGSHRLHPSARELPLFREMARDVPLLERPRRGVLLLGGRRVPYPPTPIGMLRALGPRTSVAFGCGLVARGRQRRAFFRWDGRLPATAPEPDEDAGFEAFVRDRVGDAAYRAFYAPYAEKVWGVAPAALSQSVAKKRVSTAEPWALLAGWLGRRAAPTGHARESFVYPEAGVSAIAGWLEARLAEHGVRVELARGIDAASLAAHDGPVLFAGDLADLVPTELEHRGLYVVHLALPIDRASSAETYYAPERDLWFGRVSELRHYSPRLARPGETVLCAEIPEGAWGRGVDFTTPGRLAELVLQLERAGIVPPGVRPIEARQTWVPKVYPLYVRGWMARWEAAMARVAAMRNVLPIGRQGLFLHCNIDHVAAIAADAVDHLAEGRDAAAWIERARGYLALRVRD